VTTEYAVMPARPQQAFATKAFHQYRAPDGRVLTDFHRRPDGYVLRFPGLADFVVSSDGRRAEAHPVPGLDPVTVEHLYVNTVLPLAISHQGQLAFHASAVTVPGGAIAFLGRSGAGKSTLAAQFARTGASFLTDDGLILEARTAGYLVRPNHPSIRLWEDSLAALLDANVAMAPPISYSSKGRVLAGDGLPHCDDPQPLLCAWVLDDPSTGTIELRRASEMEAVLAWIRNSFLLDVEDPVMLRRHFENAATVGRAIPTYHLSYPRRFDRLAEVQAAIVAHARGQAGEEPYYGR